MTIDNCISQLNFHTCPAVSYNVGSGKKRYRYSGMAEGVQVTIYVWSDVVAGTYEEALLTACVKGYEPSFMMGYD